MKIAGKRPALLLCLLCALSAPSRAHAHEEGAAPSVQASGADANDPAAAADPPPAQAPDTPAKKDPAAAADPPRAPGYSPWLEVLDNRFRLYGFPRLDVIYSDSRMSPNNQFPFFAVSEDPSAQTKDNDEELDIHPRLTRLGVEIERDSIPRIPTARIDGRIEIDFQNGGSESRENVRLRQGYLRVRDKSGLSLLAGQTWDLISPLQPSVNADSVMWNSGNTGDRRPQLRVGYEYGLPDDAAIEVGVGIARFGAINNRDLDGDGTADGVDSGRPMIQARIALVNLFGSRLTLGVWGHYAWEDVDNGINGVGGSTDFTSRSIGGDLRLKVTDALTISGEFFVGENLDDIRGGIAQGINTTTGREISARGGWIEAHYVLTKWYSAAVGYTIDDPENRDLDPANTSGGGPRKRNQTIYFGNRFDLGGGFQVGLEYIYWETDYATLEDGTANRVDLWLLYKF